MSPLIGSTPPLSPARSPLLWRTGTAWNSNPGNSVYGSGAASATVTGTNIGTIGFQNLGGVPVSAVGLEPAASASQAVRLEGANGAQRLAGTLIQLMMGGPNPFPGTRWEATFRLGVAATLVPNTTGASTTVQMGVGSDFGYLGGAIRGPWFGFALLGDQLSNWRVWGIDGDLGGGGSVTINADTGVAFTSTAFQTLEWQWGNDGTNNFVRGRIDGVDVYEPTLPTALGYPTGETSINFQVGCCRRDSLDAVSAVVSDDIGPAVFVDVYP